MQRDDSFEASLLEIAETYCREVAPQAAIVDREPEALKKALQGLGDRALLALKVPLNWGGSQLIELDFRCFQMIVTRYSGALAFLQAQHQSAGSLLVNSRNEALKQEYLPRMGTGQALVGVGFSHLRRRGEPPLGAIATAGGYRITGSLPWITGFGFFEQVVIGAALPNGEAVYGMMPFQESGAIHLSKPMELIAMASTNTVSATLTDWFLPSDHVVAVVPGELIHQKDRQNVLNQGFFALGCAQAGLDILEQTYQRKQLSFLQQTYRVLDEELTRCRQAMLKVLSEGTFAQRLRLRAWAINLAGRCSQAAVTASSGAANSWSHPAGRVYREALLFTVSGQTTAVMEATLKTLHDG